MRFVPNPVPRVLAWRPHNVVVMNATKKKPRNAPNPDWGGAAMRAQGSCSQNVIPGRNFMNRTTCTPYSASLPQPKGTEVFESIWGGGNSPHVTPWDGVAGDSVWWHQGKALEITAGTRFLQRSKLP